MLSLSPYRELPNSSPHLGVAIVRGETPALLPLEEQVVTVGDLDLHVSMQGEGDPFVILHHSTGPLWTSFHDQLANHVAIYAPDMPGYGRSSRPETARHPRDLAIYLHQLLDELELDQVHLMGLGFGGLIAAEMATMGQRRLASLVLVGAPGIKPREGEIFDPLVESWTEYEKRSFKDPKSFAAVFGEEPVADITNLWDYSREMTARVMWKPWMWSLQLPETLKAVRTPTLLVWGKHDRIVPLDCALQYQELLHDARLEVVQDAGHVVELEQPELLTALVAEFITAP